MLVIRMYCGADALMEAVRMSMLCKRRLLFLEAVRIKSAPCVLYKKIRMRMTRMTMRVMCYCKMRVMCHCKIRVTCHCKMRATCSWREGSLQDLLFIFGFLNKYKTIFESIPNILLFSINRNVIFYSYSKLVEIFYFYIEFY